MAARLTRDAVASVRRIAMLRRGLARGFEAEIARALREGKADVLSRPRPSSVRDGLLRRVLLELWTHGLTGSFVDAVRVAGGPRLPFDPTTREGQAIYREVGERITDINESTRQAVARYVARNRLNDGSAQDLAALIRQDASGAFTLARARMIARTESGMSTNRGSVLGYRRSGRVERVRVFDGDGDNECAAANGSTWTLGEAEKNPLGHPNCVRAFSPLVELD